jgi:hypothetical protein
VTALLTIDDLTTAPLVRRDRWGRYLVLPPEGGKPVGYTRATTVAKIGADEYRINKRNLRMVALGLVANPELIERINGAADDRQALDDICERARILAGADDAANLGTHIHAMVERALTTGENPPGPYSADVAAVVATIDRLRLDVIEAEVFLVNDRYKIAGTADLLLRHRETGDVIVADLKTGANTTYGKSQWQTQLTIYATSNAKYRQGPAEDGSEDTREPLPKINDAYALILHCVPGSGVCTPLRLELDQGALDLAIAMQNHRKAKPLGPWPEPTPEQADPAAVAHVTARIDAIKAAGHVADLARMWPEGVATLKNNPTPTADELEQITDAVGNVEAMHAMPFPDAVQTIDRIEPAVPTPVPLVAGDDPRIARMAEQYRNLPTDLQANVDAVRAQHQVPKLTSGNATEAHVELVRAALDEARSDADARYVTAKAHWDVFNHMKRPQMVADLPRPAVKACELAGIGDEGIIRATAACVENLGLLADAWEAGHVEQDADTGELVTTAACVAAVKERHGRSTLRLARKHGATLDLDPFDSTDQALTHPLIAAHLALA